MKVHLIACLPIRIENVSVNIPYSVINLLYNTSIKKFNFCYVMKEVSVVIILNMLYNICNMLYNKDVSGYAQHILNTGHSYVAP
jgi:hypothetical protein